MIAAFLCIALYVHDGDTLTCQGGRRVRLAGIDAPEIGRCAPAGRHCVPGDPIRARAALARAVQGRTLRCEITGASYKRTVAWCAAPGEPPLSCQMLTTGNARLWRRYWPQGKTCR